MREKTSCLFGTRGNEKRAFIEITDLCNMKCKHCMNDSGERKFKGMPKEEIKSLLDELEANDFKRLYISGGEPLLYDSIDEIFEYANKLGIKITLATNGWEVKNHIDAIEKYVDMVSISLDGIGDTHDKFRETIGAYDKTIEALKELSKRKVVTKVSSMIWKENIEQLEEIVEMVSRMDVSKINFCVLVPVGRVKENQNILIPKDKYSYVYDKVNELSRKYKERIIVEIKRNHGVSKECMACPGADMILHIDAQGKVAPCSWVSKIECDAFSALWESGSLNKCLAKLNNFKKVLTARVEEYEYTGCPAMAYIHNGDYMAEDPINKMIAHEA